MCDHAVCASVSTVELYGGHGVMHSIRNASVRERKVHHAGGRMRQLRPSYERLPNRLLHRYRDGVRGNGDAVQRG